MRWLAAVLLLGGCMPTLPLAAFSNGTPVMLAEKFFSGRTSSYGLLENASGTPTKRFHVEGHGMALDVGVRLDQKVMIDGEAPTTRRWTMRRAGAHGITGTLSAASGPVEGETYGNLLHLRYPMKSPPFGTMEQWLYLQPDGVTVLNEATVRVLGIDVAHISERITHSDN